MRWGLLSVSFHRDTPATLVSFLSAQFYGSPRYLHDVVAIILQDFLMVPLIPPPMRRGSHPHEICRKPRSYGEALLTSEHLRNEPPYVLALSAPLQSQTLWKIHSK